MYAISNWARYHVWAARLLIVILHIYLIGTAWWIAHHVSRPSPLIFSALGIAALVLVWATPHLKNKMHDKSTRFQVQKIRFFITGAGCFLLLIAFFCSSTSFRYQLYNNLNGAFTEGSKKERPAWEDYTDKEQYSSDLKEYYSTLSKNELRKELKYQLKNLREAGSASNGLLIALVILLTCYALAVVAALSCVIGCNGNGAAAILILTTGIAGVIFLAVTLIKKINRRKKTPAPVQEQPFINPTTE